MFAARLGLWTTAVAAAANFVCAQNDTLRLSYADAERLFEERNLLVRTRRLEATAERSVVPQLMAFDNPFLYLEQNLYNQFTRTALPLGPEGETIVQLQQLIRLAGKRIKAAKLQEQSAVVLETVADEAVRALRYELRTALGELDYFRRVIDFYNRSINQIQEIVVKYREQHARGNLSLSEKIRIETLFHDTAVERMEYVMAYSEKEAAVRLLIGETTARPIVAQLDVLSTATVPALDSLVQIAYENRPDLKTLRETVNYRRMALDLEKAGAVPDLSVGYVYDKAGNYIPNYHAFSLSVNIPVFNRNQGRIQQAKHLIEAARRETEYLEQSIRNDLIQALNQLREVESVYERYGPEYLLEYDRLIAATFENYLKRNLGFLEFVDIFQSYKQTVLTSERLYNERRQLYEFIAFTCGFKFFER
ncbi:MAG: TolC family protein [Bacteroidia bacterium]|nr:TolC family protein [Bacteroidia bacterium]